MQGKKDNKQDVLSSLKEDMENHSFRRFYLLHGEETYLVKKYRDELKKAILADSDDMNFSYFSGKDIDPFEVRDIGSTLPFFADYRVILIEETGLFSSSNTFSEILEELPESTIVLFAEKEVDKRNKLYKFVKKNGFVAEMNAMSEKDTIQFVLVKLDEAGYKIRESTMQYLLQQVDTSILNLQNELEKLISYAYGREEITKEDIDAICCAEVTDQIFQMLDAVADGNRIKVMKLYRDLLELQEEPMRILSLLRRHCNILLQIRTGEKKYPKKELAGKVGVHPYFFSKYAGQAKHFEEKRLGQMLTACAEFEYNFKRGRISDQIGVELLLIDFSGKEAAK